MSCCDLTGLAEPYQPYMTVEKAMSIPLADISSPEPLDLTASQECLQLEPVPLTNAQFNEWAEKCPPPPLPQKVQPIIDLTEEPLQEVQPQMKRQKRCSMPTSASSAFSKKKAKKAKRLTCKDMLNSFNLYAVVGANGDLTLPGLMSLPGMGPETKLEITVGRVLLPFVDLTVKQVSGSLDMRKAPARISRGLCLQSLLGESTRSSFGIHKRSSGIHEESWIMPVGMPVETAERRAVLSPSPFESIGDPRALENPIAQLLNSQVPTGGLNPKTDITTHWGTQESQ